MESSDLLNKIDKLPIELQEEVTIFIDYLLEKHKKSKASKLKQRQFGFAKGQIHLSKDFDEPIEFR
jgi:Protein of unknown function (DUF2281)